MADNQLEREDAPGQGGWFAATHWSVVLAAGRDEGERRRRALETLCQTYWEPLYTYLRRSGCNVHDAQDLTQGFFVHLLAEGRLESVAPNKGKFRSFLLTALKNFIADEQDRANAAKRGGGQTILSLDAETAETHFLQDSTDDRTAELLYDQRWATTLLQTACGRLQAKFESVGKAQQFAELSPFLSREGSAEEYEAVGARLAMKPATVAVTVHRLRHRYRDCIRDAIAHTVSTPAEIAEEMRYLLEVISQ